MANTFTPSIRTLIGPNSKSFAIITGTLVIDTAGGDTKGDIPASLFGFTKVVAVWSFVKSDNSRAYLLVPCDDQTSLMSSNMTTGLLDLPIGTYLITLMGLN